jgi:hypothetical protein
MPKFNQTEEKSKWKTLSVPDLNELGTPFPTKTPPIITGG